LMRHIPIVRSGRNSSSCAGCEREASRRHGRTPDRGELLGRQGVLKIKPFLAFVSIAAIAIVISGWTSTIVDHSMMARAAGAQAPTPTVSVTSLPAMPGTPTSAPPANQSTVAPIITPVPPVETPPLPTPPPVGVAYIPVTGQVMTPVNVTLSQLQHMKPVSLALRFHTYTGVTPTDVLVFARPTFPDHPQTLE